MSKNSKKTSSVVASAASGTTMLLDDPIARLECLLRKAEVKTAATRLQDQLLEQSAAIKAANERWACACLGAKNKAAYEDQLREATDEAAKLKELTKRLATFRAQMDPAEFEEATKSISAAEQNIKQKRAAAESAITQIQKEIAEAGKLFEGAKRAFEQTRAEFARLKLDIPNACTDSIEIIRQYNASTPLGMMRNLRDDLDLAKTWFGSLSRAEQYLQLEIWICTFRLAQSKWDPEFDGDQASFSDVFHSIKFFSKYYEPGYIDAFRHDYEDNWAARIERAQLKLSEAASATAERGPLPSREETAKEIAALDSES